MRLTKKHIGGLFDIEESDGSWCYQLIDVKKNELLFYTFSNDHPLEIEPSSYKDWQPFIPAYHLNKRWIKEGWKTGRRSK